LTFSEGPHNGKKTGLIAIMKSSQHLRKIAEIINATKTLLLARKNLKAFTRKRSMGFADALCFQLDMRKTTLQTRLNLYFQQKGGDPISQQAFSKLRANYDHSPFVTMVREMTLGEYSEESETPQWNGYYVFAVDGTILQLPRTDEMREEFGTQGHGHICPCAGVSVLFDVCNGWALDPIFERSDRNERVACAHHIEYLCETLPHVAQNSILLVDRGYPSYDLLGLMQAKGLKFLARCSSESFPVVNNAPMGSSIVMLQKGKGRKISFRIRVFKFLLPSGEIETLATNLFDLSDSDLPALYHMRWGVETAYHRLKRELCVENFSGKTPNSVRQDFWASIVLLNLVSSFQKEADEIVAERHKDKNVKHSYRARTSDLIITLRDRFVFLTLSGPSPFTDRELLSILKAISRVVSPVRPGRSFPRPKGAHHVANLNLKSHL